MKRFQKFKEYLRLDVERYPVIAVVGGGGKTSLIFRLARELLEEDKKVIVTTTTHMAYEPERPFALCTDKEGIKNALEEYGYVVSTRRNPENGKLCAPSEEELEQLKSLCDVLLVEADGSRQLPIKVPEKWEPVIPSIADIVISVVGLDCLGKPICQTAHRVERTADFLKKNLDAPITPEDVIKIASSICGLHKNVEDRVYRVYLNKADVLEDSRPAEQIVKGLKEQQQIAFYGSLKEQ